MNVKRLIQMLVVVVAIITMSSVVTAGMVAYWPLDEGTGDVFYDVSGNAYDGTVGGENVEWTTSGYINNGLEFTFTTGAPYPEVEAPFEAGVLNIEEITFALWVKMSKPFRSWGPLFVLLGEVYDWDIEPDDDALLWVAGIASDVWWGGEGEALDDNQWHHVALVCSNSQDIAVLYVDGAVVADTSESYNEEGTGSGWPFSDNILGIRLGGPRDRTQWASFGGLLDEVVVFDEPFNADAVSDLYLNGPRIHFKNRSPDYDEINVETTAVLSWDTPDDYTPTGYDVYLSREPNLPAEYSSIGQTETTFDPDPDLEYGTTYYWQLVVYEPNDGGGDSIPHISSWWPFTTESLSPYITLQPVSQTVDFGATAIFTVAGGNTTNYTWKKASDGSTVLSGADATTLTIENVQLADEDYYYCELSNDEGTVVSNEARLMTRRLVGWWKLDGDGTDSVALEVSGAPAHDGILPDDPNFILAGGIDGDGYAFYGDGRVIEIADSGEYFNFYPQGMTVSIWVNTETDTWDGVIAKHSRDDWLGWVIDVNPTTDGDDTGANFTLRPQNDLFGTNDYDNIFDGVWHLITAVMDPVTQTSRIYVDGAERNESNPYDMAAAALTTEPLVFGAESVLGQIPYTGQIDDVRIWNYPLNTIDIAMLYTDFNPGSNVCVDQDDAWLLLDIAGEPGEPSYCRIDIEDFAELALVWMECNLVPTCQQ